MIAKFVCLSIVDLALFIALVYFNSRRILAFGRWCARKKERFL